MIIIDIETSGLSSDLHGLLSIGAIDITSPNDYFYEECRLRVGEKIDVEALAVNGFTKAGARNKSKSSPKKLLTNFNRWLQKRPVKVVAGLHPASFDVPFINAKAEANRVPLRLHRRTVDLHSLIYARMLAMNRLIPLTDGWSVMDTGQIYPFCGLPAEPEPKNALNGAVWEAECLNRLIYGKTLFKKFAKNPVPAYLIKS